MKNPKLSNSLQEDLKKHSKKDKKRRIIANVVLVSFIVVFVVLAKIYIFKGDIKISDQDTKAPNEKIENQPESKTEGAADTAQKPAETPATTTTAPPAPAKSEEVYVVKEGDTMSSIANANGMTSKQLMDYNGIVDPASLMPGQNIKIPK